MKCQSCGAELNPNSRFCDSCGAQISMDMRREQEQLNKAGCPACGSSNVSFTREKQGEIRGKKGTSVVRKTVGVCKDCGHTWVVGGSSQQPKKSNTWLWVLGWICIFPVPLTILMLRNKSLKPVVRYIIIGVAWLFYLIIAFSGSGDKKKEESKTTDAQPVVESNLVVENNTTDTSTDVMNVELKVEPNVNADDGSVLFSITTNLPEDTELMVTVANEEGFRAQDKAVVLANGVANTSEFSNQGEGLKGKYTVTVSMSLPSLQKESVQEVVGKKGEKIGGQYVVQGETGESNYVSGDFDFEF